MLTCWQSHHSGSGPVQMSPLWPSFQHGWLLHWRWSICDGTGSLTRRSLKVTAQCSRFCPPRQVMYCDSSPPASTLCIRPGERTEPFLSVIKCPRAKEGWHSCGFYLQVVTPVWYGGGVCCEHLLSHNSPGALGHSQWNDTGMLINPEITRCFFVFGSGERHTDAHAEFTVLVRLTASKLHPLKHGSS